MKSLKLFSMLAVTAMALWSCGGDDDNGGSSEPTTSTVTITTSTETLEVPATGGDYTITVKTTYSEWNSYKEGDFFTITNTSTGSANGTISVSVTENPTTTARTGMITVMSGTARKYITVSQAGADAPAYDAPDGYTLVWHDEFDQGTELDEDNWTHEVQAAGWVNNELQTYVNHKSPNGKYVTEIKNGRLRINCFKEDGKIYSGRVYAKRNTGWKYGYIEASIKLPSGKGTWPAFWMMPVNFTSWPDDGEIDIMEEVGYRPNYVSSSLHANAHVHSNNTQVTKEMFCDGAEGEFHTYAIEWTEDLITTYVDGKELLSYSNRGLGRDDWPYDAPFYVIFNVAWGGSWGGQQGVDESALPVTMEVEYIRVFQKQ